MLVSSIHITPHKMLQIENIIEHLIDFRFKYYLLCILKPRNKFRTFCSSPTDSFSYFPDDISRALKLSTKSTNYTVIHGVRAANKTNLLF